MKSKILSILSLSILAILVLTSFAGATISLPTSSITFKPYELSKTFTVTTTIDNTVLSTLTDTTISDNQSPANIVTLTFSSPIITGTPTGIPSPNLDVGETATITVTSTVPTKDFTLGTFTNTYNITTSDPAINAPLKLNFENNPTEYPDNGNLNLDLDISVQKGFGDDNEWYPMDEIKVDVDVSNDGNEEIKDITIEWGLYDKKNGKWIVDDEEKDFDLDDGDDKTLTLKFKLDNVDEFEEDGDYTFYVWATGDDKETDPATKTSTYVSEEIDVITDEEFVVLDDIQLSETVSCGTDVQITADVWNIGDEEQDDVYVILYNKELGINQKVTIGDIDAFDNAKLDATITIPDNAEAKTYDLSFMVYDEDNDIYENGNDDQSKSLISFKIEGSCSTIPLVSVAANLESEAKAGQELIIKATIVNTGASKSTFSLGLSSYADWASLLNIDKTSLDLDAGESEDVLIKLKVNNDALGDKNFDIVITEGDKILTQPVKVTIEQSSLFPSITGLVTQFSGDNWYLWGIGALNVLLVLIIIVVAIKVAKKK